MSASSSKLEIKEDKHELTEGLLSQVPQALLTIMGEYLDNDVEIPTSFFTRGERLTFFGKDIPVYQQAMEIARNHVLLAGPLNYLDLEIRKNPKVLLPVIKVSIQISNTTFTLQGNLEGLANILMDRTIRTESKSEFADEGMAETLRRLRAELLPDTLPQALEHERRVLIHKKEDEKATKAKHEEVLNKAFDLIKDNKPNADLIIKAYIESTKPTIMIDNRYYMNLLQLLCRAFSLFARRGKELKDYWCGAQGDRFCLEVIGKAIESELPPRLRQILMSGLFKLLYRDKKASRLVNRDSVTFCSDSPERELGVNYFYAAGGATVGTGSSQESDNYGIVLRCHVGVYFEALFKQLHQHQAITLLPVEPQSNRKCLIM